MYHGRHEIQGSIMIAKMILVTEDMLPSFRIIAFYHTDDDVLSDSVWVDVKDSCMGMVRHTKLM